MSTIIPPAGGGSDYLITLNSGNKFSFLVNNENKSGEYTLKNSKLTFDFTYEKDADIVAEYKNNTIRFTYGNADLTFIRQDKYNFSFESNGGSTVDPITVINGKTAAKPDDPVREGHVFLGWYADESLSTPFLFETTVISRDTKVYARWAAKEVGQDEYLIKFDVNYTGGVNPSPKQTIGGHLYLPEIPSREDYNFGGWWYSMSGSPEKLTYIVTEETKFSENAVLYALWEEPNANIPAPVVNVTEAGIEWNQSPDTAYVLSIMGPNGYEGISNQSVTGSSYDPDFASAPAGEYTISLKATRTGYTTTAERTFINKALAKVSLFSVINPTTLLFNSVENAEKYYINIKCGNSEHRHNPFDNGNSTHYNFENCIMPQNGIRFTVTAVADGYIGRESEEFVYNKTLEQIQGFTFDNDTETLRWDSVDEATNYMIKILCENHSHEQLIDNGNKTSYCLKDCAGNIVVEVYPATKGYNSPTAATYRYNKTRLATPSDIKINDMSISWSPVEGAVGYELTVGDKTYTTTGSDASYTFSEEEIAAFEQGSYKIRLMAIADDATNNSLYSDYIDIGYLTMIGSVKYENNTVSWRHVLGAKGYEVQVNNGEITEITDGVNYAQVTLTRAGENTISVRVKTDNGTGSWVSTSVFAHTITFDSREGSHVDDLYVAAGDRVYLPTSEYPGFELEAWYNTPNGPNNNGAFFDDGFVFSGSGDMVLFAFWTPGYFTVDMQLGAFGDGTIEHESVRVRFGEDFNFEAPSTDTDANGVAFMGWYSEPNGEGTKLTNEFGQGLDVWKIVHDTEVYAYWAPIFTYETDEATGTLRVLKGPGLSLVTHVRIPEQHSDDEGILKNVGVISSTVFTGCSHLEIINIPASIKDILTNAFASCTGLKRIDIYQTTTPEKYFSEDGVLMENSETTGLIEIVWYPQARQGSFDIPYGVQEIPLRTFAGSMITSVRIPVSVTAIRQAAFYNCGKLTTVEFDPGNVGDPDPNTTGGTSKTLEALTIADQAFEKCSSLTRIDFPARLELSEESIFNNILFDCSALEWVEIEQGNEYFSSKQGVVCNKTGDTLVYCPFGRKGEFTVPVSILTIGDRAFEKCYSIEKVIFPYYVTTIGASAFEGCSGLNEIVFEGNTEFDFGNVTIGNNAFKNCTSLTILTFGTDSKVVSIGNHAFDGCVSMKVLNIPATVTTVGEYAFANCSGLQNITFADRTEEVTLGNEAFMNCVSLTEVFLPNAVTLDFKVFDGCDNLVKVTVDSDNPKYTAIEGVLFDKQVTELIFYPRGIKGDYNNMPDTVVTLREGVFKNNTNLTGITIGKNVTNIGAEAFYGCSNLVSVVFEQNGTQELEMGELVFASCASLTMIAFPDRVKELPSHALAYNSVLSQVTLPAGMTEIGTYALSYTYALTSITLPAALQTIGNAAFYGSAIDTIEIPAQVRTIDDNAFGASYLKSIVFTGENDIELGIYIFANCTLLNNVVFNNAISAIPDHAFENTKSLKTITIPAGVKFIGASAFYRSGIQTIDFAKANGVEQDLVIGQSSEEAPNAGCTFSETALTSVTLPARLVKMGDNSFERNSSLITVDFEEGSKLTEIPQEAFNRCGALTTITIPASVKTIKQWAFLYCESLSNLTFNDGLETIENYAFSGLKSLKTLTLPKTLKSIGISGFENSAATSVTFETGGTDDTQLALANYVFRYNYSLETVSLPKTLSSLGTDVFGGCISLKTITVETGNANFSAKDGVLFAGSAVYLCPIGKEGKVTIPKGTTTINNGAFSGCNKITEVEFEGGRDTDLTIGNDAFQNCILLKTVTLTERITSIGNNAFKNTAISSISIPASVTNIGSNCFSNSGLTSITFDENNELNTLGSNAFEACNNLTSIDLSNLTKLNEGKNTAGNMPANLFMNSVKLASVILPNNLTSIGTRAFMGTSLASIDIPKTVTKIDSYAFQNASKLTTINFDEESVLTTISMQAFDGTAITKLVLPSGVTSLGSGVFNNTPLQEITLTTGLTNINFDMSGTSCVFMGCNSLQKINIPDGNTAYKSVDGVVYSSNGDDIIFYPLGKGTEYTIEEGTKTIKKGAFAKNMMLQSVIIPGSVTLIENQAFDGGTTDGVYSALQSVTFNSGTQDLKIGNTTSAYVFRRTSLQTIEIPVRTTYLGGCGFQYCTELTSVNFETGSPKLDKILQYTFDNCTSLAEIDLPSSINEIGNYAFQNTAIVNFTINKGVSTMGQYVFKGCTALRQVYFAPGSILKAIGNNTFQNCSSLTFINIPASVTTLGNYVFDGTGLTEITLPEGITSIGDYTFQNSALEEIVIPSTVITLGKYMFNGCTALRSVRFANGSQVTTIPQRTFYNCTSLKEVVFPEDLSIIDTYAFYGSGIEEITLPEGLTRLGASSVTSASYVFNNCELLRKVVWPSTLTSIPASTFVNCTSLTEIDIPQTVTQICASAFSGCGFVEFTVEGNIKTIGASAFLNCTGLQHVDLQYGVESIGGSAFSGCTSLEDLVIPASVTSISGNNPFLGVKSFTLESANTYYTYENDGVLLSNDRKTLISYNVKTPQRYEIPEEVTTISADAFAGSTVTEVKIPSSVTQLPANVFKGCTQLTKVELPDTITSIGSSAFEGCTLLSDITLSEPLKTISSNVFKDCTSLQSITIPSTASVQNYVFSGCTSLNHIEILGRILYLQTGAFQNCSSLTEFTFPEGVQGVQDYCFQGCTSLKSIKLPNTITSLNQKAFAGCTSLTEVTLPTCLKTLGANVFDGCVNLQTVTFEQGGTEKNQMTSISNYMFNGCVKLAEINLPSTITTIGNYAFYQTPLKSIDLPSGVKSLGSYAFAECKELTNISLGTVNVSISSNSFENDDNLVTLTGWSLVTSVGASAFKNCTQLTGVSIPNVTSIYAGAFENCTGIKELTITAKVTNIQSGAFRGWTDKQKIIIQGITTKPDKWAEDWFDGCEATFEGRTF